MTTTALYFLSTGIIMSTISPGINDLNQISGLQASGYGVLIVPDGKDAATGMIINGVYQDFNPAPPPIPNSINQLIAAFINSGVLQSSAFHPTTIVQINAELKTSNMTAIIPALAANIPTI